MPNILDNYVKQVQKRDVELLGLLAWYSVPSTAEIEYADFIKLIADNDAPISKMKPPSPNNVFRRACSHSKLSKQPGPDDDITCNYMFRDVSYDKTYIYKALVEEQVDKDNHTLDHRVIADIHFDKGTHNILCKTKIAHDDYARPALDALMAAMEGFVQNKGTKIHDLIIRESARRALEGPLMSVGVRPGGVVYFVSTDKADELAALEAVINGVPEANFHILPLIDDSKQRDMLKEAFEEESIGQTRELMSEIAKALENSDGVPASKFISLQEQYAKMKDKMDAYKKLLNDSLTEADTTLTLANQQIVALSKKEMS